MEANTQRSITKSFLVAFIMAYVIETAVLAIVARKYRKLTNAGLVLEGIKPENTKLAVLAIHEGDRIICSTKGDMDKLMSTLATVNARGLVTLKDKNLISDTSEAVKSLTKMTQKAITVKPISNSVVDREDKKTIKEVLSGWF